MKKLFFLASIMWIASYALSNGEVSANKMAVKWHYLNDRIYFDMQAPTNGWVTIGFNTTANMSGAYLLMGRVTQNKAEVVEHYTQSPGDYKSFSKLGLDGNVQDIIGVETIGSTHIKFSLPIKSANKCARNLQKGLSYVMTLAYSQEDDFQHHYIMRTAVNIKL